MTLFYATQGTIGSKALYLLFVWLVSAAGAAWMADRKGYGERVGLTFGLVLTFVGFIIVLLLPGRPGSTWKLEGPLPRRNRPGATPAVAAAPGSASGAGPASGSGNASPSASGDAPPPASGDAPPAASGEAPQPGSTATTPDDEPPTQAA